MKKINISVTCNEFSNIGELDADDRELIEKAKFASRAAYAPYSKFYVGAAVRLANGKIYTGNNQENSAFPSGICAERVALFAASSQEPDAVVKSIAVYATTNSFKLNNPVTPCGACRQVMVEYEQNAQTNMRIIMQAGEGKIWITEGMNNLLPFMFHAEELQK